MRLLYLKIGTPSISHSSASRPYVYTLHLPAKGDIVDTPLKIAHDAYLFDASLNRVYHLHNIDIYVSLFKCECVVEIIQSVWICFPSELA